MLKPILALTAASFLLLYPSEMHAEDEKAKLFCEDPPPVDGEVFVEQDEEGNSLYYIYEPCEYDLWFCKEEPCYHYKTCYRYVPEYYTKCYRQYVPQYYYKECCRYVPEEYCVAEVSYVTKKVSERKCRWEPRYYWKSAEESLPPPCEYTE